MGKLDGKVALITGGARGMGAAHVRTFVEQGAQVVLGDVLVEEGERLTEEIGESCRFFRHDVTDEDDWSAIVEHTAAEFGELDVLVNNAGVLRHQPWSEATVADFRQVLEINLVSQWLGIKHAAPRMSAGGSIVNVSSVNGLVGGAGFSAYSASKFGVRGLTRSAALEFGDRGIRVNSVHPGSVATPMTGRDAGDLVDRTGGVIGGIPIARYAEPQEISSAVVFLACDDSSYCTGSEFVVDGGMTAGAGF